MKRTVDVRDSLRESFVVTRDGCLVQFRLGQGYRQITKRSKLLVGEWTFEKIGDHCCCVPNNAAHAWIESIGGKVRHNGNPGPVWRRVESEAS